MITMQDVTHRLRTLALEECGSLLAYRRLAREITDPTAGVVLAVLARDAQHGHTLLQRIIAGALDPLNSGNCSAPANESPATELSDLSLNARGRAQRFREAAYVERELAHTPLAMLLEAMAADSDKDARLLEELARDLSLHDSGFTAPSNDRVNGKAYPVG